MKLDPKNPAPGVYAEKEHRPRREPIKGRFNFDDRETKRRMYDTIRGLTGRWEIHLKPVSDRENLTKAQRGYFHGVVLEAIADYLNEPGHGAGIRRYTPDMVKDCLVKGVFGEIPVANPLTGEVIATTRISTEGLDRDGYSKLIDGSLAWAESIGCDVPPPHLYYDATPKEPATAGRARC